jgi:hypothetical protein
LRICSSGCRAPLGRTCARTGSRASSCRSTCMVFSAQCAARGRRRCVRSSRKQGTPHSLKLTLVGNRWNQGPNYSTFALLLTWTLSSMDYRDLEYC